MSALEELNEKQERGEELTSLEFAVWYCTDRVCAENAAAELADYKLRLDLPAKGATWEHEENAALREEVERLRAELEKISKNPHLKNTKSGNYYYGYLDGLKEQGKIATAWLD